MAEMDWAAGKFVCIGLPKERFFPCENSSVPVGAHPPNRKFYQLRCGVSEPSIVLRFIDGLEMGDGSEGSGDWGLLVLSNTSAVGFATTIVARILNGLGGRFRSFKF